MRTVSLDALEPRRLMADVTFKIDTAASVVAMRPTIDGDTNLVYQESDDSPVLKGTLVASVTRRGIRFADTSNAIVSNIDPLEIKSPVGPASPQPYAAFALVSKSTGATYAIRLTQYNLTSGRVALNSVGNFPARSVTQKMNSLASMSYLKDGQLGGSYIETAAAPLNAGVARYRASGEDAVLKIPFSFTVDGKFGATLGATSLPGTVGMVYSGLLVAKRTTVTTQAVAAAGAETPAVKGAAVAVRKTVASDVFAAATPVI